MAKGNKKTKSKIDEWKSYPLHSISITMQSIIPCRYANRSLALVYIWYFIQRYIRNNKIYGLDFIEDGLPIHDFLIFATAQINVVDSNDITDQSLVETLNFYLLLESVYTDIDFMYKTTIQPVDNVVVLSSNF